MTTKKTDSKTVDTVDTNQKASSAQKAKRFCSRQKRRYNQDTN